MYGGGIGGRFGGECVFRPRVVGRHSLVAHRRSTLPLSSLPRILPPFCLTYPSLPPSSLLPLLPSSRPPRPPLTLFTPSPLPPCPHATLYRVNYPALSSMPPHTTAGRNNKQPPVAMATRPSRANKTLRPLSLSLSPQLPFPGFISFHPQTPSPSPFSRSSLLSPVNVATRSPPSSTIVAQPPSPSPAATCVRAILLFLSLPLYTMRHPLLNYSPLPSSPPPRPCTSVRRVFHSLSLAHALPPRCSHTLLFLSVSLNRYALAGRRVCRSRCYMRA